MDTLNSNLIKLVGGGSVNLLWTGGWDSTFRLIELSRESVNIQPYYLFGDGRKSVLYERRAMNEILQLLQSHDETIATIQPVIEVDINTIPENKQITDAYNVIYERTQLGSQHEWLARYAAHNNIVLELGTEYADPSASHIIHALQEFTVIKETNTISKYSIDENLSTAEGCLLFANMRFPIIDISEAQMKEKIIEWRYEDIMKHIWFCHTPIKGKACGICHPCAVKMESNMEFLLDDKAQKRYYRDQKYGDNIFYKFYRHCLRKFACD